MAGRLMVRKISTVRSVTLLWLLLGICVMTGCTAFGEATATPAHAAAAAHRHRAADL